MITMTRALSIFIAIASMVALIFGTGIMECLYLLGLAFFVLALDNSVRMFGRR